MFAMFAMFAMKFTRMHTLAPGQATPRGERSFARQPSPATRRQTST